MRNLFFVAAIALIVAACGGRRFETGNFGQGSSSTSSTSSSSSSSSGGPPPITQTFSITGSGSTQVGPFQTDTVLKFQIEARNAASVQIPGYNFTANYGCVSYVASFRGDDRETPLLQAPNRQHNNCSNSSQLSPIYDMSHRLGAGGGNVYIDIHDTRNDFHCRACTMYPALFNWFCSNFCPANTTYSTHVVRGKIKVWVDGP